MRTQSIDTHPEVERILVERLRQGGVIPRFRLTASMSRSMVMAGQLARQQQQPGLAEQEAMFASCEHSLGKSLIAALRQATEQKHIFPAFTTIDLQAALFPVLMTLEQMGIACALTGPLACCVYGMQQTLKQIDILADFENVDATFLQELLPPAFFVRLTDIQTAIAAKTAITYYHLPSLFAVRVAFPRANFGERAMLRRVHRLILVEELPALPVLAPEDIVLLTLERVRECEEELARRGRHEQADDIWNELLGVLKVQGPGLDLLSIEQHALPLGLLASASRAFVDAGLREEEQPEKVRRREP